MFNMSNRTFVVFWCHATQNVHATLLDTVPEQHRQVGQDTVIDCQAAKILAICSESESKSTVEAFKMSALLLGTTVSKKSATKPRGRKPKAAGSTTKDNPKISQAALQTSVSQDIEQQISESPRIGAKRRRNTTPKNAIPSTSGSGFITTAPSLQDPTILLSNQHTAPPLSNLNSTSTSSFPPRAHVPSNYGAGLVNPFNFTATTHHASFPSIRPQYQSGCGPDNNPSAVGESSSDDASPHVTYTQLDNWDNSYDSSQSSTIYRNHPDISSDNPSLPMRTSSAAHFHTLISVAPQSSYPQNSIAPHPTVSRNSAADLYDLPVQPPDAADISRNSAADPHDLPVQPPATADVSRNSTADPNDLPVQSPATVNNSNGTESNEVLPPVVVPDRNHSNEIHPPPPDTPNKNAPFVRFQINQSQKAQIREVCNILGLTKEKIESWHAVTGILLNCINQDASVSVQQSIDNIQVFDDEFFNSNNTHTTEVYPGCGFYMRTDKYMNICQTHKPEDPSWQNFVKLVLLEVYKEKLFNYTVGAYNWSLCLNQQLLKGLWQKINDKRAAADQVSEVSFRSYVSHFLCNKRYHLSLNQADPSGKNKQSNKKPEQTSK